MKPPGSSRCSRRRFLAAAGAAPAALTLVSASVLGRAGTVAANSRLNVAFVGVGSQGLRVMLQFLAQPDVQGVAVCDPVRRTALYPQWGRNEFRDGVRKLLGADSGWDWLSPNAPTIALTRSQSVPAGVAGCEPCQKIIDARNGGAQRSGTSRGCTAYADYRELLERERDLDAVVVGTTDRLHAPVSVAAMEKGRHVFCQKPMAHSLFDARRMAEVARARGVVTQVAVGPQASEETRRLREWLDGGAVGAVHAVHNWSNRPVWPQGLERPRETPPTPEGWDWNLWLGPAPERPYHPAYGHFVWRGWHDFGSGAIGDMGCYSLDVVYRALDLTAPIAVEGSSSERFPESYPKASLVRLEFPARGARPPVQLTWYDGGLQPPRPEGWDDAAPWPEEGLLFVGERGSLLCGFTGGKMRLLPEARMKSWQEPAKTLPRSPGNEREWLDACKGGTTPTGAPFPFSARVTEALLLGNLAVRTGARLRWDSAAQKLDGPQTAQDLVRPPHRPGWLE